MRRYLAMLLLLVLLAVVGCTTPAAAPPVTPTPPALQRLFPRDALPVLDPLPIVAADEAAAHIGPLTQVIGVVRGGEARAYAVGLLSRYEVANDVLGGEPILVTFCAMCNSGIVASRVVTPTGSAPQTLSFGVSGQALDGALVMYDQQGGSLWAQSRLAAVAGPLAGTPLTLRASSQMAWSDWLSAHPDSSLVVAPTRPAPPPTELLPLPIGAERVTPPTGNGYVVGLAGPRAAVAFSLESLAAAGLVNGALEGMPPFLLVTLDEPGAVAAWQRTLDGQTLSFERQGTQVVDRETGSQWDGATGQASDGPLVGSQLAPATTLLTHWLGWVDLYPHSTLADPSAP